MIVRLALLFLLLCNPAFAQGFAGLGSAVAGFATVTPGNPIRFPQDHGKHPDFRIEWWYLTANLTDPDGTPLGLQWTLFRQANNASDVAQDWGSQQFWMGHAALTTADTHRTAEVLARGGIGQADVETRPFSAWIDDWQLHSGATGATDPFAALTLSAGGDDFSYQLNLTAMKDPVLHGDAGFSRKSDAGQASYYYSQPFLNATGSVTLDGVARPVVGTAWLDREWSSQPLAPDQSGWDWFSLHFEGGAKLMAFRLRQSDDDSFTSGSWISAEGGLTPLGKADITLSEISSADIAGRDIPIRWRIRMPARGIDIETTALNPDSFMPTLFPYWEGPIHFTGTHRGVGYLEMTGYE